MGDKKYSLSDEHWERLDRWFTYHVPNGNQCERYVLIRDAARALAEVIYQNTPSSPDQAAAIRKVREAVMTANAAIACEEE